MASYAECLAALPGFQNDLLRERTFAQPGQFRAPSSIAVDGRGRVYVGDFKGIQVFDANGRYLTVFKPEGNASGMVFNDKDELFVAARNHVVKLTIAQ